MVQPATDPLFDLNLSAVSEELRDFLIRPQDGARGIAKKFFAVISEIRKSQFSAPAVGLLPTASEAMFDEIPIDVGHFGRPYYAHVLRGLRRALPDYATDLVLQGGDQTMVPNGIDGIVIVHV
jgi:hypothetical protein